MENIDKLYNFIIEYGISGEAVADLFTNYHGNQLVTDEFIEYIQDEGYEI